MSDESDLLMVALFQRATRVNRSQSFNIMSNFERKSEEGKSELLTLSVTAA